MVMTSETRGMILSMPAGLYGQTAAAGIYGRCLYYWKVRADAGERRHYDVDAGKQFRLWSLRGDRHAKLLFKRIIGIY